MQKFSGFASCLFAFFLLTSCTEILDSKNALSGKTQDKLVLQKTTYAQLPNWADDKQGEALQAFAKSCQKIAKRKDSENFSGEDWTGKIANWQQACQKIPSDQAQARAYFENNFTPYSVSNNGNTEGLFTGYFEASLRGSLIRQGPYQIPLRAKPEDLVQVDLGTFRPELKGQRIAGRVIDGTLKPYQDRTAIETGQLPPAQDKVLLWVDDAVDAFFLQIQGSGIVTLQDGTTKRVGFDGQNGHPYYAIGKELVKRGALQKDNVTMQSIKDWLAANPVEATDVMRTNKSYVFFRFIEGLDGNDGPIGAQGVALTPGRSLAVDRKFTPYGVPVYLDASTTDLKRLMIAQDTGGAIQGPVRGDVFFGHGVHAEQKAGPLQTKGSYWFLLPKSVSPPNSR